MLEVEPSTPLAEVLALASMRLGVNVDALRAEDDDEAGLELLRDGAHLVAYERKIRMLENENVSGKSAHLVVYERVEQ